MRFTLGIEDWDSFMIIPNEFVKDHELSQEEITVLMTPNAEYEQARKVAINSKKTTLINRIKRFIFKSWPEKIYFIKIYMNRFLGRRLQSMWKSYGVKDTWM